MRLEVPSVEPGLKYLPPCTPVHDRISIDNLFAPWCVVPVTSPAAKTQCSTLLQHLFFFFPTDVCRDFIWSYCLCLKWD